MKNNKEIFRSTLIWLMFSFPFGYLVGVILVTLIFIPSMIEASAVAGLAESMFGLAIMYKTGFVFSLGLFVAMAPIFLLITNFWLRISRKRKSLDKSWIYIVLLTLLIGIISAFTLNTIMNTITGFSSNYQPISIISITGFFGGWFGTLLPRIFIKKLRPGKLC